MKPVLSTKASISRGRKYGLGHVERSKRDVRRPLSYNKPIGLYDKWLYLRQITKRIQWLNSGIYTDRSVDLWWTFGDYIIYRFREPLLNTLLRDKFNPAVRSDVMDLLDQSPTATSSSSAVILSGSQRVSQNQYVITAVEKRKISRLRDHGLIAGWSGIDHYTHPAKHIHVRQDTVNGLLSAVCSIMTIGHPSIWAPIIP
jgi:hypothetical protein